MTRKLLQQLTKLRLKDSKILLDNKSFSGSYYLAGYAIELALKSCFSKQFKQSEIPDKSFVNKIHTHDLRELMKHASLEVIRQALEKVDPEFATNWAVVTSWTSEDRYKTFTEIQAKELYSSITSRKGGVLKWIQKYW